MKSIFGQMVERLFPTTGRQGDCPMKCVDIQDNRKLRPKDNKEANLGILEHFGHKNLGILEHFEKKNLGILEFLCIFAPRNTYLL